MAKTQSGRMEYAPIQRLGYTLGHFLFVVAQKQGRQYPVFVYLLLINSIVQMFLLHAYINRFHDANPKEV